MPPRNPFDREQAARRAAILKVRQELASSPDWDEISEVIADTAARTAAKVQRPDSSSSGLRHVKAGGKIAALLALLGVLAELVRQVSSLLGE